MRCSISRGSKPAGSRRASSRLTWAPTRRSWPAPSSRRWSAAACATSSTAPPASTRSTSIATCGRRSSSTSCRTRSSSRWRERSPCPSGARRIAWSCGFATLERASRRRSCRTSLPGSIASKERAAGRRRAPASGCRWCSSWSSCTAGRSTSRASPGRGRPSPLRFRSGTPICPPTASWRRVRMRCAASMPTRSSPRPSGGCRIAARWTSRSRARPPISR